MKILFVASHLGGGAGKAISGMAIECSRFHDIWVMILEPAKDMKYINYLIANNIQIIEGFEADIYKSVCSECDIIIFNWWNHPISHTFLKNIDEVSCRLIVWNHINGCSYPYLPFQFLNEFDGVFFTSEYSLQNKIWNEEEKKCIEKSTCVIYGMGDFCPSSMKYKEDYSLNREFVVGYVGTLNYAKMCPDFIEYCIAAVKLIPNIKFLLVGEPDEILVHDIEDSGIMSHFDLTGYVQDPEKYYLEMDVFGYLLKDCTYATTENSLLEAMAYGLPIVVLNQQVERAIISQNINGFLVENPSMYGKLLYQLFIDKTKRETIGKKARDFVCSKYNKDTNYNYFIQACERLLFSEKRKHTFKNVIGDSPYESFCFFAGEDVLELQKMIKGEKCDLDKIKNTYKSYTGESKSSIRQFVKYFPDDKNLDKLLRWLEGER